MMKHGRTIGVLWLTCAMAGLLPTAQAQLTYRITVDNRLIAFDAANPTVLTRNIPISGLSQPNELILGIDIRPRTGELYAVGSSNRLYKINPNTGMAMSVGSGMAFSPSLSGVEFGFDFNPTVDRIRLTSDNRQNLRLHPDTGQVVAVDGPLTYNSGDPNFGRAPHIVGSAYTNNFHGATSTILYNIDSNRSYAVDCELLAR